MQILRFLQKNILGIIYALFAASLLVLAFNTQKFLDYFYFSGCIENDGIKVFLIKHYFWWDGRFLTFQSLVQASLIKLLPHAFIIVTYVISFLAFAYMLLTIVITNQIQRLQALPLVSILLFYGFYTHIANTVFWAVGGVYIFSALLLLLYIKHFNLTNKLFTIASIITIGLSFIAGGLGQNMASTVLLFIVYQAITQWKTANKWVLCLSTLAALAAIALVILAPGNFKRTDYFDTNMPTSNIMLLIQNYFFVLLSYIKWSWVLIIGMPLMGLLHTAAQKQKNTPKPLDSILYIAMAFATGLPFSLLPGAATPRTAIFFMALLCIGLYNLGRLVNIPRTPIINYKSTLILLSSFAVIIHLFVIPKHIEAAKAATQLQVNMESEILLQKNNGIPCITIDENIVQKEVFSVNHTGTPMSTTEPTFWVNEQLAVYYKVNCILAK